MTASDLAYHQTDTADSLMDIAQGMKSPDAKLNEDHVVSDVEAKKEQDDMAMILEKLNLAAVNNRVFSISDETQQLLQRFNQVFKDLVNGVPTAYDDLESLLTNGDQQLQKTFNQLPSFLQKLIEQLPKRMTESIAPELMAAAAERAEKSGINTAKAAKAAGAAKKMGFKTPTLKDIAGKPGTIATMMRTIIGFLRARFPAFLGMNVLWSLALFGKPLHLHLFSYRANLFSAAFCLLVLSQAWQGSSFGEGKTTYRTRGGSIGCRVSCNESRRHPYHDSARRRTIRRSPGRHEGSQGGPRSSYGG
jgi:hypothetical protein